MDRGSTMHEEREKNVKPTLKAFTFFHFAEK